MIVTVCQSYNVFSSFHTHLIHPCQPTYSFSVQCLRHFRSDFVFISSLSGFPSSYGCCHFCQYEDFLSPKINLIACVSGFKVSSKYYLHRERISFSSTRMFPVKFLIDLFSRKRRMVCQNTLFSDE